MTTKYRLEDKKSANGLYRIVALRDFAGVKAGDVGGFVESTDNLSQSGDCWVSGNAKVYGSAAVAGNARVYDNADMYDNARVYDNAEVFGNAQVFGDARVYDNAEVNGNAWVFGNAEVFGNAVVYDNAEVYDNATVHGNAMVYDNATVYGNAQVYGNATATKQVLTCGPGRDYITVTDNHITIGCEMFTHKYWLQNWQTIGQHHDYSHGDLQLYGQLIKAFADRRLHDKDT